MSFCFFGSSFFTTAEPEKKTSSGIKLQIFFKQNKSLWIYTFFLRKQIQICTSNFFYTKHTVSKCTILFHILYIKTNRTLLHLKLCGSSYSRRRSEHFSVVSGFRDMPLCNTFYLRTPRVAGQPREVWDSPISLSSFSLAWTFSIALLQNQNNLQCFQMWAAKSVSFHMARVGPLQLRLVIQPQEVFVARSATHPGLPKPHCPSEKELAFSRLHPTLQGHLYVACPAPYPHAPGHKDVDLLSVKAADLHGDRCVVLLQTHRFNGASCHCRKAEEICQATGFTCWSVTGLTKKPKYLTINKTTRSPLFSVGCIYWGEKDSNTTEVLKCSFRTKENKKLSR